MKSADFMIVGGGLAAAHCAATLRKEGAEGSILLVSAEPHFPYSRPPLSKGLLLGYEKEEDIFAYPAEFYRDNDIDVRLETRIAGVDGPERMAIDTNGEEYTFGKMLLATGCAPRKLSVAGGDLGNMFYLRTLDDSRAVLRAVNDAKDRRGDEARAVVVGAGFIGMELASALVQHGIKTTMLVRDYKLFSKLNSPELSDYFEGYYRERGVEIVFRDSVSHFEGDEQGHVEKVITTNGKVLPADIVAIGIGVVPETGFLDKSSLTIENGVVVDEYLRSPEQPHIFAAGDIANFYDPVFEKRRRIEHWDNAIKQGKLAARNMLDAGQPYNMVSYFYSDLFDLSWEFLGDNMDIDETVLSGSFEEESAVLYYLKENRLKAAFLLRQTAQERKQAEEWILRRTDMSEIKKKLAGKRPGTGPLASAAA